MATGTLKDHLRDLRRGKPGHRFRDHYEHEQSDEARRDSRGRWWRLGLGLAAVAIGAVLCVIPGPGLPFLFIGGGLLAAESLFVARIMDRLELLVRAVWRWARERWWRLPRWGRIVVGTLLVATSAGATIFFWRVTLG